MTVSITEIAKYLDELQIDHQYTGSSGLVIKNFCALSAPRAYCITWIKDIKNYDLSKIDSGLNMLFVTNFFDKGVSSTNYNIIECNNPKETFFEILNRFFVVPNKAKIQSDSVIETACIGKNVSIGHHCFICKEAAIGDNVIIKNNVIIECPAEIGDNTIIWSGVVIGTDGFGYFKKADNLNHKVPHFGGVKIGRNVEIGANTCIDRGTLADTIIEDNVKIDNLCHIAHNDIIKDNVMITANATLAGSTAIGKNTYIAPAAVILNQLTIGKDAFVTAGAVVMKDVPENAAVYGNPARVLRKNNEDDKFSSENNQG
jgi:UDP-3-O-[3-hydroxymyristoyl] glucosamine N-acyltransferase